MNQKLIFQVWSPGLHRRKPGVKKEGSGGQGGEPLEAGEHGGRHETLREDRAKRPKSSEEPGRCSGAGGGRAGEKDPVRGSCCDSEKRL